MTRILLFASSYPPILGGLQTVVHTLAQHLLCRGHDVQVVTNRYPRSLPTREVLDGVSVHRRLFLTPDIGHLKRKRSDLFIASFYFLPTTLFYLTRLVQTFHPEVVNVHFPAAQIPFVLWLRRRFDLRLVVSLHGHEIERWFGVGKTMDDGRATTDQLVGRLAVCPERSRRADRLRSVLQEANAVTACSRYLLDKAIQLEPSVAQKGHVIHNGIDPTRFEDRTSYRHPRPYILAYGRLTYQKGFDLLLQAFKQVAPAHPGVDLLIAGAGEEQAGLQTLCRQLDLNERVTFYGRATPQEVVALLNGCEFVVASSRWEPFGIVALEAMAAGKAMLATRVGGLPEFVDGSANLLVEPTVEGLAEGFGEWLGRRDEVKVLGARNRQRAAGHTWERVVERYLEVYSAD